MQHLEPIYDPFKFVTKTELFTIAVIGSFVTMKLLNSMYENIYEPMIDITIDTKKTNQYYLKIGDTYVPISEIVKELIKWFVLIVLLMLVYNLFAGKHIFG